MCSFQLTYPLSGPLSLKMFWKKYVYMYDLFVIDDHDHDICYWCCGRLSYPLWVWRTYRHAAEGSGYPQMLLTQRGWAQGFTVLHFGQSVGCLWELTGFMSLLAVVRRCRAHTSRLISIKVKPFEHHKQRFLIRSVTH